MSGGALESSVTLEDVFTVVGARRVPLAPELAGYLVLEIAERAGGGDVDPKAVYVSEEGSVALVRPKKDAASGDAEASIRAVLARLLEASGSQTPSLAAASRRKGGGGLAALAEELEAALIPVNRAAGRRALARLAREVRRVTHGVGRNALPSTSDAAPASRRASSPSHAMTPEPPPPAAAEPTSAPTPPPPPEPPRKATPEPPDASELPTMELEPAERTPSPSQTDVDSLIASFGASGSTEQQHARALKAIAGLDPTPPPPPPEILERMETREVSPRSQAGDVDALLAMQADPPARPREEDARKLVTQPTQLATRTDPRARPPSRKKAGSWPLTILLLLVAAGGVYAAIRLRPGVAPGAAPARPVATAPAAPKPPPSCIETLVVTDVPPHAEVLLREGQAPLDVARLPVGARLEFVATAEGYAPKRVVVPAGATWDPGAGGGPRYEAAVQLDRSRAARGGNDPWPAGEPGSEVGGSGPPGTVHVVATPRGAEIWMLVGLGPEASIQQQLRCDEDVDLLLAGPTTYRKRLHVTAADFVPDDAPGALPGRLSRRARVSAK